MCNKFSSVLLLFIVSVVCVQSSFDKLEGEPCETEGIAGKCAHIYKCLSAFLDVKKRKHPTICSFQGREPIVCCTDCELVSDAREAIIGKDGTVFYKSSQKAENKCIDLLALLPETCETGGMSVAWKRDDQPCKKFIRKGYVGKKKKGFSTVVVGGTDAKRYNFTHMALLGYGEDRASAQWHCGGSLISEKFILTAGHCISDPKRGPVRFVVLGILKRSDPEDLWQVYNVKRIVPHPEYRPPSKYHDIALLETDKLVTYNKAVFPACLDVQGKFFKDKDDEIIKFKDDDEDDDDDNEEINEDQLKEFQKLFTLLDEPVEDQRQAVATGWGKLGRDRELSDTLQEVYLNRFSERKCLVHFQPNRNLKHGYNATTQMCYGDEKETKDTCEGDSGGPLQVRSQVAHCLHTVIGVTSFGKACGYLGEAGMYSRVYHYVSWIESVVWPGED
ncbi:hypothetical protein PYW08_012492 [Mythimna loreyi]|uniref:Uncharacterized protein n=1 Tax=Mythimna loreyi TaxID=667449 RepID=A0ACC2Q1M3_9NEOP|nr:hypothetical protein PYW08_012492 [Mythimna loreyi]